VSTDSESETEKKDCGATLDGYGRVFVCDRHIGRVHWDTVAQVMWASS
jgi:hypothetical protein